MKRRVVFACAFVTILVIGAAGPVTMGASSPPATSGSIESLIEGRIAEWLAETQARRDGGSEHLAPEITVPKTESRSVTMPESDPVVVLVDCSAGESIARALQHAGTTSDGLRPFDTDRPLIIEIHGICEENLQIYRNKVTLRGSDPEVDGIRGVDGASQSSVLYVRYVNYLALENLTITNGATYGLSAGFSNVYAENCRFVDNGRYGALASATSYMYAGGSAFSGNGFYGVGSTRNSRVWLEDDLFENNGRTGVLATYQGEAWADNVLISGSNGVDAQTGAMIWVWESEIREAKWGAISRDASSLELWDTTVWSSRALYADRSARATVFDSVFEGGISAQNRSHVRLYGLTQLQEGVGNFIWDGAQLDVQSGWDVSLLVGELDVRGFGIVQMKWGCQLDGDIVCQQGGDAVVHYPQAVNGTITGCEHATSP